MARVASTVRDTVRRGLSSSSDRYTAVVKPCNTNRATASPAMIASGVTRSAPAVGCNSTLTGLLAWPKPSTATTAAATTSTTRNTPVIQALARRLSRPVTVASSSTSPPATGPLTCTTGLR